MHEDLLKELGKKVQSGEYTWAQATMVYNSRTKENIKHEALKKRFQRMSKRENKPNLEVKPAEEGEEFRIVYADGTIDAQRIVNLSPEEKDSPEAVLRVCGYNTDNWEMVKMGFSNWNQHTKEQTTKQLYAVRFTIKPKQKQLTPIDLALETVKVFKEMGVVNPNKLEPRKFIKGMNMNRLLLFNIADFHLGRLSWNGDTGYDYDQEIAKKRFKEVVSETILDQEFYKCGEVLIPLGNDFFNSDTPTDTTTKGTQQSNDIRWKKMYRIGLELWIQAITDMKEHFNKVHIQFCPGNHDEMLSYTLFVALEQYFKEDKNIEFINNSQKTQVFEFGINMLVTDHGETNLKRLVESVPNLFHEVWGRTTNRELISDHTHDEETINKVYMGMMRRKMPSFATMSEWEYKEKYLGANPKHLNIIYDKEFGTINTQYINFQNEKKAEAMQLKKRR